MRTEITKQYLDITNKTLASQKQQQSQSAPAGTAYQHNWSLDF